MAAAARIRRLLHFLGELALEEGSLERACSLYEESLVFSQELNLKRSVAAALHGLGRVTAAMGKKENARGRYTESLELFMEMGNRSDIAACLQGLVRLGAWEGESERVVRLLGAAVALRQAAGA